MTLLELCNRVRQESGVSGPEIISVSGQQGMIAKIVAWVKQADTDIVGMRPDWNFLWRTADATLVTDQQNYSVADLSLFNMDKMLSFQIGTRLLKEVSWEQFKYYGYNTDGKKGMPQGFTYRPDGVIAFYPTPDQAYVGTVEFSAIVEPLLLNNDESLIPVKHRDVIVQKALMYYSSHEEDNSLYSVASQRYEEYLTRLAVDCTKPIVFPHGNGGLY
ncbi:phage adaptor protein [Arsukibacterium indicum]|uniref:Uncharacterized protein n=1 Tax=Arsukibacterium indicum TaxID=2848612 RepID=A0ABS6MH61_9GAMM|nr:hypothetical protein [Arsukibacterium indicum]MBV2128161.1 hypothetical protein [Arsukibacterium indicum]